MADLPKRERAATLAWSLLLVAALTLAPHMASAAEISTTFSSTLSQGDGVAVDDLFSFHIQAGPQVRSDGPRPADGSGYLTLAQVEAGVSDMRDRIGIARASGLSSDAQALSGVAGRVANHPDVGKVAFGAGTMIPLVPATLMLLTAIGAVFGFAGLRKAAHTS